jgi:hypothetical protein
MKVEEGLLEIAERVGTSVSQKKTYELRGMIPVMTEAHPRNHANERRGFAGTFLRVY